MIIDQVLVVAGRMIIEFSFRHLLPVCVWYRYSVPMGSKIDDIEESVAMSFSDWRMTRNGRFSFTTLPVSASGDRPT